MDSEHSCCSDWMNSRSTLPEFPPRPPPRRELKDEQRALPMVCAPARGGLHQIRGMQSSEEVREMGGYFLEAYRRGRPCLSGRGRGFGTFEPGWRRPRSGPGWPRWRSNGWRSNRPSSPPPPPTWAHLTGPCSASYQHADDRWFDSWHAARFWVEERISDGLPLIMGWRTGSGVPVQ